jgi:hypothetical protein
MAERIMATVTGRLSENLGNNRSFIFGSVIFASYLLNLLYTIGISTRVRKVALSSPAMMVTAIGVLISVPSPNPKAMGNNANTVVEVVIKIGLSRTIPACLMASNFSKPRFRSLLI